MEESDIATTPKGFIAYCKGETNKSSAGSSEAVPPDHTYAQSARNCLDDHGIYAEFNHFFLNELQTAILSILDKHTTVLNINLAHRAFIRICAI